MEIRDPTRGHKLITLIEILSPSNKRSGPDREAYAGKQREVLESDASLIELDLLRGGRRVLTDLPLAAMIERLKPKPSLCRPGQPGVATWQAAWSPTRSSRSACASRSRASRCR